MLLIVLLLEITWSFALIFIICEFGEKVSQAFEEIEYKFGQFDWYLFPSNICKMLPIFISIANKPVSPAVFGSISCCREAFKNVFKNGFSYFMVLREFGF